MFLMTIKIVEPEQDKDLFIALLDASGLNFNSKNKQYIATVAISYEEKEVYENMVDDIKVGYEAVYGRSIIYEIERRRVV